MVVACHCKECQKLSTSAFSITAIVRAEDIEFSGELSHWQRGSASGNISAAKFCGRCGNRIYHYNPAEPQSIKLKPVTWKIPVSFSRVPMPGSVKSRTGLLSRPESSNTPVSLEKAQP